MAVAPTTWFEILSIMLKPGTACTYPNACEAIQQSMSLEYEPASEPLHICVK